MVEGRMKGSIYLRRGFEGPTGVRARGTMSLTFRRGIHRFQLDPGRRAPSSLPGGSGHISMGVFCSMP